MLDTKDYSLKQMSITEIEKVIAEALGKVTNEEYQVKIGNLDFEFKDFMLSTKINLIIEEQYFNMDENETEKLL